jgi:hypothetical protein
MQEMLDNVAPVRPTTAALSTAKQTKDAPSLR